jgi:hypothetical protein
MQMLTAKIDKIEQGMKLAFNKKMPEAQAQATV